MWPSLRIGSHPKPEAMLAASRVVIACDLSPTAVVEAMSTVGEESAWLPNLDSGDGEGRWGVKGASLGLPAGAS